jgi:hypothetical protein
MASGDFIIEDSSAGNLTPPQRNYLRTLVDALWLGAIADVDEVVFRREPTSNNWEFSVRGSRSVTPANVPNRAIAIRGREP